MSNPLTTPPRGLLRRVHNSNLNRTGTYTVEFALCIPVLFMFTFACFEYSHHEYIKHSLNQAAYQGARAGICINGTQNDIKNAVDQSLLTAGLGGVKIEVTPAVISSATREVTVTLTANYGDYFVPPQYFGGGNLVGRCTLDHENASLNIR